MMMAREGMARPVVIPKHKEVSQGAVRSACQTLGISIEELFEILDSL